MKSLVEGLLKITFVILFFPIQFVITFISGIQRLGGAEQPLEDRLIKYLKKIR